MPVAGSISRTATRLHAGPSKNKSFHLSHIAVRFQITHQLWESLVPFLQHQIIRQGGLFENSMTKSVDMRTAHNNRYSRIKPLYFLHNFQEYILLQKQELLQLIQQGLIFELWKIVLDYLKLV